MDLKEGHRPNRLIKEKSPYLLQHAHNPVDWFPWSDEAFVKAKRENKAVFLSIGYSTCHWCHVMERESFEDEEVAKVLNEHFVSIKVDREERPDVDHLYMTICQAMTGEGGWPLTIVMTPEKKPFFAGTYYPKHRKYGRPGLIEILGQIAEKWQEDREKITEIGDQVVEAVQSRMLPDAQGEVSERLVEQAFHIYRETFDSEYGGFGGAPKFPTSHNLSLLLRYYHRTGHEQALQMVEKTLDAMYRGGLYDHIGYGFARYSTDEQWLVPHFEKMLYDNALLAMTFLEAYQVTDNSFYSDVAEEIFTYILRDMTDPDGAFYCAEDADSEGVEGKFYVWTPDEVKQVLGEEEGTLFCEVFDITDKGNFEGNSIPNLLGMSRDSFRRLQQIPPEELEQRIEMARQRLFDHREGRIHPHKDDKILTSWNGLMIAALAKGAKALQNPEYAKAAERAVNFILSRLVREDGRLLARYRDGEAAYPGYIDDYAFLVWGLIELYEATFDLAYLQKAVQLNEDMLRLFWDAEKGGFFFYGSDGEQLFTRPKEIYDGAIPSGNSVSAMNLLKLAKYTSREELSQKADEQLRAFTGTVEQYPAGYSLFVSAVDFAFGPGKEIVIAGNPDGEDTRRMLRAVQTRYSPNAISILVPEGEKGEQVREWIPLVQDKVSIDGKATAYICENYACQSPITDPEKLEWN
ncbi:thioredoxin domain-containing protein [Paenibacillus sp. J2TS4]|uniref:thioredoxin domain-containing protein n=1 Tax=Paenibacillus sp. J2TS4 TaxID=2807194 RepID=UPI001B0F071D|nr:thioredoxin domain-containing protein [Paenibacillus sp. J2TS4]GIP32557.1 thioredoxin domain-containing protein [Paenibacillus sp. J2TS4]